MEKTTLFEAAIQNYELAFACSRNPPSFAISARRPKPHSQCTAWIRNSNQPEFWTRMLVSETIGRKRSSIHRVDMPNVDTIVGINTAICRGTQQKCQAVDQPIGALLSDLKQRGLSIRHSSFGRVSLVERHLPKEPTVEITTLLAFSIWLAGGGIRGGTTYGETDEWGIYAIKDKCEIHDCTPRSSI